MTIWESIFLGAVQGLTEFLPVSSDGHLAFFQHLLGMKGSNLAFDIAVHFGTLLATVLFFRKEIITLTVDVVAGTLELCQGRPWSEVAVRNPQIKTFLFILIASVPTGFMGIYLKDFFEGLFTSLVAVGFGFWVTTLFLWLTQFRPASLHPTGEMKWYQAFIIGICQGLAIAPGISRSGTTISTSIFFNLDREFAARFSFILSLPAILGANLIALRHVGHAAEAAPSLACIIVGISIAAIVGYFALRLLVRVLVHGHFHRFAYYTLAMGALSLIASLFIK